MLPTNNKNRKLADIKHHSMTLEAKKLSLLGRILSIDSSSAIDEIDNLVEELEKNDSNSTMSDLDFYVGNIEEKVDVEKIAKEQGVKKLSMEELDVLIEAADFQEDINELLTALK